MKTYPTQWEKVNKYTYWLKVPGGWLVNTFNGENSEAMAYVPDPNEEWKLKED